MKNFIVEDATVIIDEVKRLNYLIEDGMLHIGRHLSELKKMNIYKLKGYSKFSEYVEEELKMASPFVARLIKDYEIWDMKLGIEEDEAIEMGHQNMKIIRSVVDEIDIQDVPKWIDIAKNLPSKEIRAEVSEYKAKKKADAMTIKEILVEQYIEKATDELSCSKKDLDFKLALFFQDIDYEELKQEITKQQHRFEDSND